MTLYWFKAGANSLWATLTGNWWNDEAHTEQADAIPASDDDVIIVEGSEAPVIELDAWTPPASIAGSPVFTSTLGTGSNAVDVLGDATFNSGVNTAEIVGDVVFNGGSSNEGAITGNVTFNGTSFLAIGGRVIGDAIFNDTSRIVSPVSGISKFNDHSLIIGGQITVRVTEGLRGMSH